MQDTTRETFDWLRSLEKYDFQVGHNHNGNAASTRHGVVVDRDTNKTKFNIQLQDFGTRFAVTVTLGEVRNIWNNHTPLGEYGIASASSHYVHPDRPDQSGSALPGNKLTGLKYRIGVCAPKSRTGLGIDGYVICEDIVAHLINLVSAPQVRETAGAEQDFAYDLWDTANIGW